MTKASGVELRADVGSKFAVYLFKESLKNKFSLDPSSYWRGESISRNSVCLFVHVTFGYPLVVLNKNTI